MRLSTLSIRAYLVLAFGTAMTAIGISTATTWWGIAHVSRFVASEHHGDIALAEAVDDMRDDVLQLRRYEKDVFINIGSPEALYNYRVKWDRAFQSVRYDLVRTRAVTPESASLRLQEFADSMAAYRSAFLHTYGLIQSSSIDTTQQANDEMSPFKGSVRQTERQLAEIKRDAERRISQGDHPVINAQRLGLGLNVCLLIAVAGLLAVALHQTRIFYPAEG